MFFHLPLFYLEGSPLRSLRSEITKLSDRFNRLEDLPERFVRLERKIALEKTVTSSTYAKTYSTMPHDSTARPWFPCPEEPLKYKSRRQDYDLVNIFWDCEEELPPGSKERDCVQPYWDAAIKDFPSMLPVNLCSKHKIPTIGTRKPDLVGYLRGKSESIFYICLIGELKPRRAVGKGDFDASEKGQLLSFMEELLVLQSHRVEATGFLSDGVLIQFFRLVRQEHGFHAEEGPPETLTGQGALWLRGALEAGRALGLDADVVFDGKEVNITEVLGVGGTATVYAGTLAERKIVVKRFRPSAAGRLEVEVENLTRLKELRALVPELIGITDDRTALLLSPVGKHFSVTEHDDKVEPMARHFCALVDILKEVHENGLVHRDIRLSNFFLHPETQQVFLNDWGCATAVGQSTSFSGAWAFAPDRVLMHGMDRNYSPKPADDLEMVVKCIYQCLRRRACKDIAMEADGALVMGFWKDHLAPSFWQEMLDAAANTDYKKLKQQIKKLLL